MLKEREQKMVFRLKYEHGRLSIHLNRLTTLEIYLIFYCLYENIVDKNRQIIAHSVPFKMQWGFIA